MNPLPNNTFCYYPFYQLALKYWKKDTGIVQAAPCCNSQRPNNNFDPLQLEEKLKYHVKQGDHILPKEIFYGKEMSKLRNNMLKGVKNPICNVCWDMEGQSNNNETVNSYRLAVVEKPINDLDINNPKLLGIDFAFEETCNLRCRHCSPGLSNQNRIDLKFFRDNKYIIDSWGDHINLHEPNYVSNSENLTYNFDNEGSQWKSILDNIHELRVIKATGGETLLTKSFNQFLDVAIEKDCAKNITLEFHTNATVFTSKMMEKLNHFKKINPTFSIDSVKKSYEYVRYPMIWNLLQKSVYKFIDTIGKNKVDIIHINSVINVITAFDYKELCEWSEHIGKKSETTIHLWLDELWPNDKAINITFLPHSILTDLKNEYLQLIDEYNIKRKQSIQAMYFSCKHIINLIDEVLSKKEDPQREKMLYEIQAFDASRKQDYHDFVHPKLIEFLDKK
jgi:hypothetical protein